MSKEKSFRDKEKKRLTKEKHTMFSEIACINGTYTSFDGKHFPIPFYLNDKLTEENIYGEFRSEALQYFQDRKVKWHRSSQTVLPDNKPDNHLCCSQSFCINTFFQFIEKPIELNKLLVLMGYQSKEVLPFYLDEPFKQDKPHYICFEWIGKENYLDEKIKAGTKRSRGQYFTSVDFAIRFLDENDKINLILGEWKYTETNSDKMLRFSVNRTDRYSQIYKKSLDKFRDSFNLINNIIHEDLFFEPFDQLMRLTLLAKHMEENREMDAENVSILLITPSCNNEYNKIFHSPKLINTPKNVAEIWQEIVGAQKFKYVSTEDLFDCIKNINLISNSPWFKYLNLRYKSW